MTRQEEFEMKSHCALKAKIFVQFEALCKLGAWQIGGRTRKKIRKHTHPPSLALVLERYSMMLVLKVPCYLSILLRLKLTTNE